MVLLGPTPSSIQSKLSSQAFRNFLTLFLLALVSAGSGSFLFTAEDVVLVTSSVNTSVDLELDGFSVFTDGSDGGGGASESFGGGCFVWVFDIFIKNLSKC